MSLARLPRDLRDEVAGARIEARIGADHIHLEVADGVRAHQARLGAPPAASDSG